MSNSKHVTVNWRGQKCVIETRSTIILFDHTLKIRFTIDPNSAVNPTGIKTITIEQDQYTIISAISEQGEDLSKSPILVALSDWIKEYYQLWSSLRK